MAEIAVDKLLERATLLSVPRLDDISLLSFSTNLGNNQDLLSLIKKCVYQEDFDKKLAIKNGRAYKDVEAKANELVSELPKKPDKIKDMILEFLWPVTYRIIRWKSIFAPTINDEFLQYFHWTDKLRIDDKRTAKYIIENKMIPIKKRFMLACRLGLSNEIHELWEIMSDVDKADCGEIDQLLCFWIEKLQGKFDIFGGTFNEALLHAVKIGSIEAIKYLFSVVPNNHKNDKAILCSDIINEKLENFPFLEEDESDIGYFIFQQMSKMNQETFYNFRILAVLLFLLYFPGQKEFLRVLTNKLKDISKKDIKNVLLLIFYKLYSDIFKDYDYQQLFVSVWKILGAPFKKYLLESKDLERCFCLLMSNYFRFLLIKSPSKKAKNPSTLSKLIGFNQDKWALLHFFIKNEIVTTKSLSKHRSRVLELLHIRNYKKQAWRRLMMFVRDNGTKKERK